MGTQKSPPRASYAAEQANQAAVFTLYSPCKLV